MDQIEYGVGSFLRVYQFNFVFLTRKTLGRHFVSL